MIKKLSKKELVEWKKDKVIAQGFTCPFCGKSMMGISLSKLAADHDHETGHVRAVLHMGCNRAEGIILKALNTWARSGSKFDRVHALRSLANYWVHHINNPSNLLYPTHGSVARKAASKSKTATKKGV